MYSTIPSDSDSSYVLITSPLNSDVGIQENGIGATDHNTFNLYGLHLFLDDEKVLYFAKVVFLLSGVCATILTQWMYYIKVADSTNLLTITSQYTGMALVAFLPSIINTESQTKTEEISKYELSFLKGLSALDIFTGGLLTAGMFKIGSSIYQVVYSLVIPCTALLTRLFLRRRLNAIQWLGILAIVIGFSFNTIASYLFSRDAISQDLDQHANSSSFFSGLFLTLGGVLGTSCHIVLAEKVMANSSGPSPRLVCKYIGVYASLALGLFFLFFTLPHRSEGAYALIEAVTSGNTSDRKEALTFISNLVLGFSSLTAINILYNYSYFFLVDVTGAVSTGILQALRSVFVIAFSAAFFCDQDMNQCLNIGKGASAFLVVLGVLVFSHKR